MGQYGIVLGLEIWECQYLPKEFALDYLGQLVLGALNVTIECGGVVVNPGDLILGDDDGVLRSHKKKWKKS